MLNVVVVTPEYQEGERDAGIYAHSLVSYLQSHGHRMHVVCSQTDTVRPGFEYDGFIQIYRLACKRNNLTHSFAALAVRQVHELIECECCDRILVIRSDAFMVLYHATHLGSSSDLQPIRVPIEHVDDSWMGSSDQGREREWEELIRFGSTTSDARREAWESLEQISCSASLDGSVA